MNRLSGVPGEPDEWLLQYKITPAKAEQYRDLKVDGAAVRRTRQSFQALS